MPSEFDSTTSHPDEDREGDSGRPPKPTITLTPHEQIAFWAALSQPGELTPAQRMLGEFMRGEE